MNAYIASGYSSDEEEDVLYPKVTNTRDLTLYRVWFGDDYHGWDIKNLSIDRKIFTKRVFITASSKFKYGKQNPLFQLMEADETIRVIDLDDWRGKSNIDVLNAMLGTLYIEGYAPDQVRPAALNNLMTLMWKELDSAHCANFSIKLMLMLYGKQLVVVNFGTRFKIPHPTYSFVECLLDSNSDSEKYQSLTGIFVSQSIKGFGNLTAAPIKVHRPALERKLGELNYGDASYSLLYELREDRVVKSCCHKNNPIFDVPFTSGYSTRKDKLNVALGVFKGLKHQFSHTDPVRLWYEYYSV